MANKVAGRKFLRGRWLALIRNRNTGVFLTCLLLSAMFWLMNALARPYLSTLHVVVSFVGLPNEKVVQMADSVPMTFTVRANGYRTLFSKLKPQFDAVEVVVDPKFLKRSRANGVETLLLVTSQRKDLFSQAVPFGFELVAVVPDSLVFGVSDRSTREVKLIPILDLKFDPEYGLSAPVIMDPEYLSITGPKEVVDTMTAIHIGPIQLTELHESVAMEVPISGRWRAMGVVLAQDHAEVHIPVSQMVEGRARVPLTVHNQSSYGRIRVLPDSVDVVFVAPMSTFTSITPEVFRATVNLSDSLVKSANKIQVQLTTEHPNLGHMRAEPDLVEFIVLK